MNKKSVLVIGDSHALVFNHDLWKDKTPMIEWEVVSVGGATLSGLTNPHSQTQAMPLFEEALMTKKADAIVFQLGEVDLGFVIHYRAEKKEVCLDSAFQKAVDNYQRLLEHTRRIHTNIIVMSTCLPTIKDGQTFGNVANLRKEIKATQYERTALTIRFNAQMEAWCNDNAIHFLNLDHDVLGNNGVISDAFLHSEITDHHYEPMKFMQLLDMRMLPILQLF